MRSPIVLAFSPFVQSTIAASATPSEKGLVEALLAPSRRPQGFDPEPSPFHPQPVAQLRMPDTPVGFRSFSEVLILRLSESPGQLFLSLAKLHRLIDAHTLSHHPKMMASCRSKATAMCPPT